MAVLSVRRKEGKHSHGSYQNRFHVGHTMLENALAGQAQAQPEVQTAGVQECLDACNDFGERDRRPGGSKSRVQGDGGQGK